MNFIPTFYPKAKYLIIFARLLSGVKQQRTSGIISVTAKRRKAAAT